MIKFWILKKPQRVMKYMENRFINNLRAHSDVHNIRLLSRDIDIFTREKYSPNSFYGHARHLKKFACIPKNYQLKCMIEHGVYFGNYIWDYEMNFDLPVILTFSDFRKDFLQKKSTKVIHSIGPLIAYSDHYLDVERRNQEKERVGRNLLVFPAHSTHFNIVNFNINKHCERIKELGKDFDTIRVCLYWKDIILGYDKNYRDYGFECITAGHIYDPFFLPRLKTIIETSTITVSNQLGTHIGYCLYLNKPHFLDSDDIKYKGTTGIPNPAEEINDPFSHEDIYEVTNAFNFFSLEISEKQKSIVNRYWGIDEIKTSKQLNQIITSAENYYKK